jgi:hypothetical protein
MPLLSKLAQSSIINRYELTDDKKIIIDIAVRSVEDLYDNFDRTAGHLRRDLEQNFVDYLISSVKEIGAFPFIIRISLICPETPERVERTRNSIKNFFNYLYELQAQEVQTLLQKSILMFGLGFALLALSIFSDLRLSAQSGIIAKIIAEGITVVAWVSLWEASTDVILEWHPCYKRLQLYRRIMNVPVHFRQISDTT